MSPEERLARVKARLVDLLTEWVEVDTPAVLILLDIEQVVKEELGEW